MVLESGWSNNATVAAIVGALVAGGIGIAIPTITKKKERARLVALLMDEVFGHQASVCRFLDEIMPEWMKRGVPSSPFPIKDFIPPHLSTTEYERIREKLIFLTMIVGLKKYYDKVDAVNRTAALPQLEEAQRDTIGETGNLLAFSLDLTGDVLRHYPLLDGTERSKELVHEYRLKHADYEFITQIMKCSRTDLELLVRFIDQEYFSPDEDYPLSVSDTPASIRRNRGIARVVLLLQQSEPGWQLLMRGLERTQFSNYSKETLDRVYAKLTE